MWNYEEQRNKSDLYLESFKDILERNSLHFLNFEVSDEYKDTQEATDMVIKVKGGDVALRVREPNVHFRDLTIRSRSRYGGKTEIDKLREGFGKWYLYGWGDGVGNVNEYILVDLDKVRSFKILDRQRKEIPNYDGTKFINISISELIMTGCLIASKLNGHTEKMVDEEIRSKLAVF